MRVVYPFQKILSVFLQNPLRNVYDTPLEFPNCVHVFLVCLFSPLEFLVRVYFKWQIPSFQWSFPLVWQPTITLMTWSLKESILHSPIIVSHFSFFLPSSHPKSHFSSNSPFYIPKSRLQSSRENLVLLKFDARCSSRTNLVAFPPLMVRVDSR